MRPLLWAHLLTCVVSVGTMSAEPQSLAPVQDVQAQLGEIDTQGSLPPPRGGHTLLETVDRRLLLWGGCDLTMQCDTTLYALNTVTESWQIVRTDGAPPAGRTGHSAWIDRTNSPYMWVFGGFQKDDGKGHFSNDLSVLYLANMRWSKPVVTGQSPSARYEMATTRINASHTFLSGGSDGSTYFDDAYFFDSDRFMWIKLQTSGEKPLSRESHTAVYLESSSEVLVYGGYHHDQCLDDTFSLDLNTMTWRQLATQGPGARGGHAAFVMGGRMFVVGGCNEPAEKCHESLDLFDPLTTRQWARANMTRSVTSREWSSAAVVDRSVYMFGGCLPNDKCLNDLWLIEFESALEPLQLVSMQAQAKTEAKTEVQVVQAEPESGPKPELAGEPREFEAAPEDREPVALSSVTVNSTLNGSAVVDCPDVRPTPQSRPGRDMMEALKEVRRQLRLAESDCDDLKAKNKRMRNTTATEDTGPLYPEQYSKLTHCPPGTVAVPLAQLNLEKFNKLIKVTNKTLHTHVEEESLAQIALLEVADDDEEEVHVETEVYDDTGLVIDTNETLHIFPMLSLENITVCFGPSGPVGIIGSNMTLQQLFAALNYNRTLEPSTRKAEEYKPSPSPSPLPYNATVWEEDGRYMGRRVNQGKRRPLGEVADRVDKALTRLNCTDPLAARRPECTMPFANLSGHLNATANWTHVRAPSSGDGEAGGEDGSSAGDIGGEGDAGGEGDGSEGSGDGSGGAGKDCAEGDEDCLAREAAGQSAADCAPDDIECLNRAGQSEDHLCAEGDTACQEALGSGAGDASQGTLGGTTRRRKSKSLWQQVTLFFQENGALLVLVILAALGAFVAIGAVMTNVLREKRKLARLEQSLKDAQLKQEDEVWTKSVVNPNM